MFRSIWEDIRNQLRQGDMVLRIIILCIAVFVGFETFHFICWIQKDEALYENVRRYLFIPASFHQLIKQPWSVITFMFMHEDVEHILWNMLFLYWFGEIYQLYMKDRRVLPIFVFGSIAGSALSIALYHVLPPLKPRIGIAYMLGASAGVQAVMWAATALNPEHKVRMLFIGYIPLKYVAVGFSLMDYLALTYGNAGGEIAHIGGAIFGYTYILSLRAGADWFRPLDMIASLFRPKSKLKATYINSAAKREAPSDSEQKRVDTILDKIAKSGYNSLSKEEKDFLFKYSNK